MAPKATFAQLCKELTEIKDATDHHIFELYGKVEPSSTYPFAQGGTPKDISLTNFIESFYPDGGGQFKIHDCCDNIFILNNWRVLDYPFVNPGTPTVAYNAADILTLVPQQWVLDLSHNNTCCWTACSYMEIQKELLEARDLCTWNCDVCCAMSSQELASVLNHQDPSGNRTALMPVRKTGSSSGLAADADVVVLAVLFTNPHVSAKPIELRLNFKIV